MTVRVRRPRKSIFNRPSLFDFGHVELSHRQAVVGGQRQIVVRRFRRDDHARRMGGGMPGHSLHLQGGVDELGDLRVVYRSFFSSVETSNARFRVIFSSMGTSFATTSTC